MKNISDSDKREIMNALVSRLAKGGGNGVSQNGRPFDVQAQVLKDMLPYVEAQCPLKRGDFVAPNKWAKDVYRYPPQGQLALVTYVKTAEEVERDHRASISQEDRGNRVVREDCVIVTATDNSFVEFAIESWRFDKVNPEVDSAAPNAGDVADDDDDDDFDFSGVIEVDLSGDSD